MLIPYKRNAETIYSDILPCLVGHGHKSPVLRMVREILDTVDFDDNEPHSSLLYNTIQGRVTIDSFNEMAFSDAVFGGCYTEIEATRMIIRRAELVLQVIDKYLQGGFGELQGAVLGGLARAFNTSGGVSSSLDDVLMNCVRNDVDAAVDKVASQIGISRQKLPNSGATALPCEIKLNVNSL